MKVIGLMGTAGAGKDSTADVIVERAMNSGIGADRFAFADRLRDEIAAAFGIDRRVLLDRTLKDKPLEQLALRRCTDAGFVSYAWELSTLPGIRPRTLLQRWGDWRRMQDPDYFIYPVEARRVQAVFSAVGIMVVTDVRYQNEAAWVRRNGGLLWRIVRPGLQIVDSHSSEHSSKDIPADAAIVNDGDLDHLQKVAFDLFTPVLANAA